MATKLTHLTHSPQPLPKLHNSHGNWSWLVNHLPHPLTMTLERANLSFQAQIRPQTYPNYKYTSLPLLSRETHKFFTSQQLHLHLLPQTKRERSFQSSHGGSPPWEAHHHHFLPFIHHIWSRLQRERRGLWTNFELASIENLEKVIFKGCLF